MNQNKSLRERERGRSLPYGRWKNWRQEEKGMTEDKMVGCHHRLNGHEFQQAPGDGDGQGGLVCCSPWGCKESDMTELNWTEWSITSGLPELALVHTFFLVYHIPIYIWFFKNCNTLYNKTMLFICQNHDPIFLSINIYCK